MASGTLGGDELREKHRWGDNIVYKRKFHKKGTKNSNKKDEANNTENDSTGKNHDNIVVPQPSPTTLPTTAPEDGNNPSQPQNLSQFEALSNNSSSHNRSQVNMANGCDLLGNDGNGLNSVFTQFENRVKINISAARSKSEVREVRRTLVGELEQVRSLVMKLEAVEVQLNGYFTVGGDADNGADTVRVNSKVGSAGQYDSQLFGGLRVAVNDNNHNGYGDVLEKEKRTPKANQYYQNSDFLLGKDKLPPPGRNKRLKPNGFRMDKQLNKSFKSCNNLLTRLMKHKYGWVFNEPVDVKAFEIHDYYTIIQHPMDLGTIKTRLSKNWYKTPREFAEDVRLTFRNAMTYNPKGNNFHVMAEELSKIFEEKWAVIDSECSLDWRSNMIHDIGLQTPAPEKAATPHPLPPPPSSHIRSLDRSESMTMPVGSLMKPMNFAAPGPARTPVPKKPKAKDPNKRDMTYEEKQKLSVNLSSLPSEKLDNVVQIIKKRNSALSQHDDEIEVDIDSVDAETLWELDRFITNYKKSLSKYKRKAELALQARPEAGHDIQTMNPGPVSVEAPEETRTDGENVSTSVQGDKQGNNVSRSSSSSSSSSDSGSSSSDSDSESSSASGSDASQSPRT